MPIRRLLAAAALLLLSACGDATAPDPGLLGTFTLRTIAGKTLPWAQSASPGDTVWVLGGTRTFNADSTYLESYEYRYVHSGVSRLDYPQLTGPYRAFGDSVEIYHIGPTPEIARRSGRTLVVHGRYEDWVYRR